MKKLTARINNLVYFSQTAAVRFWFGLSSIAYAGLMFAMTESQFNQHIEYILINKLAPINIWISLFLIHGISTWYGVITQRYNRLLLFCEGVLGTAIWVAISATTALSMGTIDVSILSGFIAVWLLIRYPTHRNYTDTNAK